MFLPEAMGRACRGRRIPPSISLPTVAQRTWALKLGPQVSRMNFGTNTQAWTGFLTSAAA